MKPAVKRALFGAGLVLSLGWAFATVGVFLLAAEMNRPCRCGRKHDPIDEHPEGPPSLSPEELQEMMARLGWRD